MDLSFLDNVNFEYGSNLVIMCGPPGSGKTTVAKKIVEDYPNFVRVSANDIRKEVTGNRFDQSSNTEVFRKVYDELRDNLNKGFNVVYDATNTRAIYRRKIISVVNDYVNKIVLMVSTTPIADCIDRNANREDTVPDEIVEKMYFSLKNHPPAISEGFDMIVRC